MPEHGGGHEALKRSREAVERARANEGLMQQVRASRIAHQRGERGISGKALREELERRERQ